MSACFPIPQSSLPKSVGRKDTRNKKATVTFHWATSCRCFRVQWNTALQFWDTPPVKNCHKQFVFPISYIYGFICGSKLGTRPVVKKFKVSFPHDRINPISMNGHNLPKRRTLEFPFLMLQSRCFYALATFLLRWKQCFPQEGKTSRKPRDMCDLPAKHGGFFAEFSSYGCGAVHCAACNYLGLPFTFP